MTKILIATSAAALASLLAGTAPPAHAQAQQSQAPESGAERPADALTCGELTLMDTAQIPGALYFIAGHAAGRGAAAAGSAPSQAEAPEPQSPEAPETAAAEPQPAGEGAQPAAGGNQAQAEPATVQMAGFFDIPIEQTVIACAETPDRPAAEVIEEQGGPVE